MKLIFDKPGKYMNNYHILEVTEDHVEAETVFKVDEDNGTDYIRVKKAHVYEEPEEEPPAGDFSPELDKMTVAQLEEFAAAADPVIDLAECKNKDEKIEAIKAVLKSKNAE